MKADIGFCRRRLLGALAVGMVTLGASAFGQSMRIRPIRTAPLGSPVGTLGAPVTSQFNDELGCWEVVVPAGSEVDLAIEATEWELAPGAPYLYAIGATVDSNGYSNGIGGDLNPKGWPDSPTDGAYLPTHTCQFLGANGDPCVDPFDPTCDNTNNGFCVDNPNFVMPPCTNPLHGLGLQTLNYGWGSVAQANCECNANSGLFPPLGGLILEVPNNAAGTYVIALNPDPNTSWMTACSGAPLPVVTFTPACITITDLAPPIRAPSPHHILKNRYISIDPRGASGSNPDAHHIRVTLDSTEVLGVDAGQVDSVWWANNPDANCISLVGPTQPVSEPNWAACPTLHLSGCAIIPTTTYFLVTVSGESESGALVAETQSRPADKKWWGDAVGSFDGAEWSGPQGVCNFDDVTASLKTFQNPNAFNATHTSVTDIHPNRPDLGGGSIHPNKLVNGNDMYEFIVSFQGREYPGGDLGGCTDP